MAESRKEETIFSSEASFGYKRQKLLNAIEQSGIFNQRTLESLNSSLQTDGSYLIYENDPTLINNVKSIANILHALEKLMADLSSPLAAYRQTQGCIEASYQLLGFTYQAATSGIGSIKNLANSVFCLNFYLQQLQQNLATLPGVSDHFIPLVTELNLLIQDNIAPLSQQEIREEMPTISSASVSVMDQKMNQLIQELELVLAEDIEKDHKTGLYTEENISDKTTLRIVQDINTIKRFKAVLENVNHLINHSENSVITALSDLIKIIRELKKIDVVVLKRVGAQELLEAIRTTMLKLHPALINTARFIDTTASRLGIDENIVEADFRHLCESYETLANTLDMPIHIRYPFWETRLEARKTELYRSQTHYHAVKNLKKLIEKTNIDQESSILDLLILQDKLMSIDTYELKTYQYQLTEMIDIRMGLKELNADINNLEEKILQKGAQNNARIEELKRLYDLRTTLQDQIKEAIKNKHTDSLLYYDKHHKGLKTQPILIKPSMFAAMFKSNQSAAVMYKTAIQSANNLFIGAQQQYQHAQERVKEAEEHIIQQTNLNEEFANLNNLYLLIKELQPEDLYFLPIADLQQILRDVRKFNHSKKHDGFERILLTALTERTELDIEILQTIEKSISDEIIKKTQDINFIKATHSPDSIPTQQLDELSNEIVSLEIKLEKNLAKQTYVRKKLFTDENLEQAPNKHYDGRLLEHWETEKNHLLKNIREEIVNAVIYPTVQMNTSTSPSSPSRREVNTEEFIQQLLEKKQGSLRTNIQHIRNTILKSLPTIFTEEQMKQFMVSPIDGLYPLLSSDSLLVKNTKTLLNILTTSDKLTESIRAMKLNELFYQGGISNNLNFLTGIKQSVPLIKQLMAEFSDLSFYTNELGLLLKALPISANLPDIARFNELIKPAYQVMEEIARETGLLDMFLNLNITNTLNSALLKLKELESASVEKDPSPVETVEEPLPLQGIIQELDNYIQQIGISRDKKTYSLSVANNNADIRHLLILYNSLVELQTLISNASRIPNGINASTMLAIVNSTYQIALQIIALNDSRLPNIKDIQNRMKLLFQGILASAHPSLIQIDISAVIMERRLGLKPGLIENQTVTLCQQYAQIAEGFGLMIDKYPPFAEEKITELERLDQSIIERIGFLVELQRDLAALENNKRSFLDKIPLKELLSLKERLKLFPSSQTGEVINSLDLVINAKTGFQTINQQLTQIKAEMSPLQTNLFRAEKIAIHAQRKIDLILQKQNRLMYLLSALENSIKFTMNDIQYMHNLFNQKTAISLDNFCTLLALHRSDIQAFLERQLAATEEEIKPIQAEHQYIQHEINRTRLLLSEKGMVLKQFEIEAANLNTHLTQLSEADEMEFGYPSHKVGAIKLAGFAEASKAIDEGIEHLYYQHQIIDNEVNALKASHSQQLQSIQNTHKINLDKLVKAGVPEKLLTKIREPANLVHTPATQSVRGLMLTLVAQSDHPASKKYQDILNTPIGGFELAEALQTEAKKHTSILGRWFRRMITKQPSFDDMVYHLATYFSDKENTAAYFPRMTSDAIPEADWIFVATDTTIKMTLNEKAPPDSLAKPAVETTSQQPTPPLIETASPEPSPPASPSARRRR